MLDICKGKKFCVDFQVHHNIEELHRPTIHTNTLLKGLSILFTDGLDGLELFLVVNFIKMTIVDMTNFMEENNSSCIIIFNIVSNYNFIFVSAFCRVPKFMLCSLPHSLVFDSTKTLVSENSFLIGIVDHNSISLHR